MSSVRPSVDRPKFEPGRLLQVYGGMERLLGAVVMMLHDRNLGWLCGRRLLVLGHVGRVTGRRYRTVLEVMGTDPESGEVIVMAGLGHWSNWYRNLRAQPTVEVAVGRRHFRANHRQLEKREASAVLADYDRRNRWMARRLHRFLVSRVWGWRYDGSEEARQRLAHDCPLVALRALDSGRT